MGPSDRYLGFASGFREPPTASRTPIENANYPLGSFCIQQPKDPVQLFMDVARVYPTVEPEVPEAQANCSTALRATSETRLPSASDTAFKIS